MIYQYLFQEPVLFSGSIKDNILYGALDDYTEDQTLLERISRVSIFKYHNYVFCVRLINRIPGKIIFEILY